MKKLLLLSLLAFAFVGCLPVQNAGAGAVNALSCDAEFVFTDTGLQFDPQGVVSDLFITISGESVVTAYEANEVALEFLEVEFNITITSGSNVAAIASYERETRVKPFVCIAQ